MLCRYERTIYQARTGYCIFAYRTEDSTVPEAARKRRGAEDGYHHFTAVGYNLPATGAVRTELTGKWTPSRYGLQLQVGHFEQVIPRDRDAIAAFLSSGLIKGVGPGTAKAIVSVFGEKTMEILDRDPSQLLKVKGIAEGKLRKIVKSYRETVGIRDLVAYLAPYGVSIRKAAKIMEEFGDSSLSIVQNDPFQLTKVKGFGFLTVDEIARRTKVSMCHPLRCAGAVRYVLEESGKKGHLYMQDADLIAECHELLNRDCAPETVTEEDDRLAVLRGRRSGDIYEENTRVYLTEDRMCEVDVAKKVVSMLGRTGFTPVPGVERKTARTEKKKLGRELSPSQRAAVRLCLTHPCSVMTGGPGTGKTTTLLVILDVYRSTYPDREILLAAPTGRAGRRLAEQTGMPARTLHSALGLITDEDPGPNCTDMLSADLVVVDEMSMVDMRLAYELFVRLKPDAQIIMVGDPDQLPSVGAGNVLREFLRCELIPTAVLDSVFRQAANGRIYLNAQAVNHNDTRLSFGDDFVMLGADSGEQAAQTAVQAYLQQVRKYGIEGVQILSPFRKRGETSANALNARIRELVNPARNGTDELRCGGRVYRVGDRVIQMRNREDVSNGDVGVITGIFRGRGDPVVTVRMYGGHDVGYDPEALEDLELSYCLTVHKSQGGEYPCVIMPLLKEHSIMLRRNLLYTGITRAKEKVILIGQKQAVCTAIHRDDVDKRNTVLADRILAYAAREKKRAAG